METGDRVKNRKRQKNCSNCKKHICLLSQLAYSPVICLLKQVFQVRRRADTDPRVQGESSVNVFFSAQEKQSGSRNKIPFLPAKRMLCNTTLECNKLIFGSESKAKPLPNLDRQNGLILSGKMV